VIFPAVLIAIGMLVFGVARYSVERTQDLALASLKSEERQAVIAMTRTVRQTLVSTTAALDFLVLLMQRSLNGDESITRIAETLLDFSLTHREFDQLRFIDKNGLEVVRVDDTEEGSLVVPPSELQNKSERGYFLQALALPPGQILVTPLEFNQERGVVEYPLNPVIRLAMPVFDAAGANAGVAVVNYKARRLLDELAAVGAVARGNPNILSMRGRWLMEAQPGSSPDYRVNGPDDLSFLERFPDEWGKVTAAKKGLFRTENGLYTYRVVVPATIDAAVTAQNDLSWTVPQAGSAEEGGWVVMSHVTAAELQTLLSSNPLLSGVPLYLLSVLVALVAWFVSLQLASTRARAALFRQYATTDTLTGLANRREFDHRLTQALSLAERHSRCLAVIYVDINHFKQLNDRHGHGQGDALLIAIGARLVDSCRKSDLAARLGGDEFGLILFDIAGSSDATAFASKLERDLHTPLEMEHGIYSISVSVGAAVYPNDGATADELLAHADQAMHAMKSTVHNASADMPA
jgi:diguanylate cyclase (GGDEF)-like protein